MKFLDYLNPLIWAVWLIGKVMRLSQKIPAKVYYGFAIILMLACLIGSIVNMF